MAAGTVPLFPIAASAEEDRNYDLCASELLATGLDPDTVAQACSLAYRPTEVSGCVTGVLTLADVTPVEALGACSRDRRPDEVATCVTSIHEVLVVKNSFSVLDYCHRSILPERYAACVIGITATVGYTTDESLYSCIAAGYRPENVAPTYIPLQ
jgi:hypothetical protein